MQSSKPPGALWFVSRREAANDHQRSKPSVIVVERSLHAALPIISLLSANEFHITLADNFLEAKQRLSESPPDLLITQLALGEYNGIGLVVRGKSHRADLAAVVLSSFNDPVLQADTEANGATFVRMPVSDVELRAAVFRTLLRERSPTASPEPIRPPFERRRGQRRQQALFMTPDRRLAERRADAALLFADWAKDSRRL